MVPEAKTQRVIADPHRRGAEPFEMHTIGASRFDSEDPYHAALTVSWPAFLGLMACAYLLTGLVFALLYGLSPGHTAHVRPGHI